MAASSEAGIRQTLGPDSLGVMIDEFEGDARHLKTVVRLARSASAADDPLLRGTPEGKAQSFALRATFAFFAVNPLGMSVADESRIVMLELTSHDNSNETAAEIEREIAYFQTQHQKWCSMMVARAGLMRQAVERFAQAIGAGDRRHRQNMATLLAGAFVARYGMLPDDEDLKEWSEFFAPTVELHAEEQERDDAQECLDYLFAHLVRGSEGAEYPLRHWIAVALADADGGNGVSSLQDARRIVEIYDMRIVWPEKGDVTRPAEPGGVLLKNGSAAIERVYAGSRWADGGWKRALRKLEGVVATGPVKFDTRHGAKAHRATKVPLSYVPPAIGAEDAAIRRQG